LEFENYDGTLTWDESGASDTTSTSDVQDPAGQLHDEIPTDDDPAPIIYDEIVVQPPPGHSEASGALGALEALGASGASGAKCLRSQKPLNRPMRRRLTRTFKAMLKGNWKWPRNYQEAMEAEDAKQWGLAMQKELESIMKNETWTLIPCPKDAKVVKSRWVLRTKDNGLYKARFCAKGFTQRWGEDYDKTFAPVAKYTEGAQARESRGPKLLSH
jgi:hypothetical protein